MLLDLLLLDHNHHHRIVITTVGRVSSLRFPRTPPFCSSPSFSCCRLTHSFPKRYPQMTKRKKKFPPLLPCADSKFQRSAAALAAPMTSLRAHTHTHAQVELVTNWPGNFRLPPLPLPFPSAEKFSLVALTHTHARTHNSRFKRRRRRISRILCCCFTRSSICTLISWPGWC